MKVVSILQSPGLRDTSYPEIPAIVIQKYNASGRRHDVVESVPLCSFRYEVKRFSNERRLNNSIRVKKVVLYRAIFTVVIYLCQVKKRYWADGL